jgi:hypothetical protein
VAQVLTLQPHGLRTVRMSVFAQTQPLRDDSHAVALLGNNLSLHERPRLRSDAVSDNSARRSLKRQRIKINREPPKLTIHQSCDALGIPAIASNGSAKNGWIIFATDSAIATASAVLS